MYQKIKILLTKNITWKAFSILLATLLWFIVMNINNPTEIKTYNIPINTDNLKELSKQNITILNLKEFEETKIELKLKASRPVLDELTKKVAKNEIISYLDTSFLNGTSEIVTPAEFVTQIKTNLSSISYPNNNFELLSLTPISLGVRLDTTITVTKKLEVRKIGTENSGYLSATPQLSDEYIQVTGASSIINNVSYVYLDVDISNKSSTFTVEVIPVAYDKNGNVINDVSFNLETVNVKIPMMVTGSVKINKPNLTGDLPTGYTLKDISYYPTTVSVVGNYNDVKNVSSINLPDIDISNLTSSKEFKFNLSDILKDYNLSVAKDQNTQVTVSLKIEASTEKTLTISTENLEVIGVDEKLIDLPDNFDITVTGLKNDIENINLTEITANIDIKNLTEGTHYIKVTVSLPENISLVTTPYINVTIYQNLIETSTSTITEKFEESIESVEENFSN